MDFNNMQTWHYFSLGGGGLLVLGIIVYFLPVGKMKIPGEWWCRDRRSGGGPGGWNHFHGRLRVQAIGPGRRALRCRTGLRS